MFYLPSFELFFILVLFLFRKTVQAWFSLCCIIFPIVYFSNSATGGPQPDMKKEKVENYREVKTLKKSESQLLT